MNATEKQAMAVFDLISRSPLARLHFLACFYVDGLFGTVSVPLNILILLVFTMSSHGTTRTTRIYYLVVALCELVNSILRDLMVLFVGHGLLYMSNGAINMMILNASVWHCRVMDFVMFTVQMTCNYTYVALAAERCLVLYFPLYASRLISRRKAVVAVATIATFSVLLCSGLLAGGSDLLHRSTSELDCYFDLSSRKFVSKLAGAMLLLTWFVSASLITILNVLIVSRLVLAARSRRRMSGASVTRAKSGSNSSSQRSPCTRKAWQASVTLLLICGLHDVIQMPMAICRTLPLFTSLTDEWLSLLFYPFLSINHVINFIVFTKRVTGFRQNVCCILRCSPNRLRAQKQALRSASSTISTFKASRQLPTPTLTSNLNRL